MVGDVAGARLRPACRPGVYQPQSLHALVQDRGDACGGRRVVSRSKFGMVMRFEGIELAAGEHPRICSVISNPRRAKWLPKLSIKVIP